MASCINKKYITIKNTIGNVLYGVWMGYEICSV